MARERGFSLAEMAVVLVIVGLLIGGLLAPLATQMDQRNFSDTQKRIEYAREELLGFAIANGRLPCPASSTSGGDESFSNALTYTCSNPYDGYLPAKALGVQQVDSSGYAIDAYGNRIRYALAETVKPAASCPNTPPFSSSLNLKNNGVQCLPGDLDLIICKSSRPDAGSFTDTSCGTNDALVNRNTIVAIIFSMGKNGATSDATTRPDEWANTDTKPTFVYHTPAPEGAKTTLGAVVGEFDDQMVWISAGLLYGRMVSAGILP